MILDHWLVAELSLIPCSRLSISEFKSCISIKYIQITLYSKREGCCTGNLQSLPEFAKNQEKHIIYGLLLAWDTFYKPLPSFTERKQFCC